MNGDVIRNSLKEAIEKNQKGLVIWSSMRICSEYICNLDFPNDILNSAISQLEKGEEAVLSVTWNGLSMPGFLAVSVDKLAASDDYIDHIVDLCNKNLLKGPISFLPSNDLSSSN